MGIVHDVKNLNPKFNFEYICLIVGAYFKTI